jgi:hypothetical protein
MTSDSPPKAHRVFVSYVREDQETVERLAKELSAYGIKVWLDTTELKPGTRWRDAIREAISQGDFFIACFSEAYQRRIGPPLNKACLTSGNCLPCQNDNKFLVTEHS